MMKINLTPNSVSKPVCSLCREIILETFFLQGMSGGQHQPLKVFARRVPPRDHPEKRGNRPAHVLYFSLQRWQTSLTNQLETHTKPVFSP